MSWVLGILFCLELWLSVSGQTCQVSSKKEGYCREKHDCFGVCEQSGCGEGLCCCELSGKATEKCKEYSKHVFSEDYGHALLPATRKIKKSECGADVVSLIVGGKKAGPKEFPHMVSIGYGDNLESAVWMCGGSLISENFVLTAAHCAVSPERGKANFVKIGALNLKKPDQDTTQDLKIAKAILHPRYKYPSLKDDIALFQLESPVVINEFRRPACLHTKPDEMNIKKVTATGWGKLNFEDTESSADLMKVEISFFDSKKCDKSFSSPTDKEILGPGITAKQICAGEEEGGKDTCQGDSGGPLQIILEDPFCMYSIVGVTSFGKFCGFENSPAIYSRVSYYVSWIESIVWP